MKLLILLLFPIFMWADNCVVNSDYLEIKKNQNLYKYKEDLNNTPIFIESNETFYKTIDGNNTICYKDIENNQECLIYLSKRRQHIFKSNNSSDEYFNKIIKNLLNHKSICNIEDKPTKQSQNISIPQKRLYGDIDGDGKDEIISWKLFASNDLGDFYQLLVFDDNKKLLWQGPKVANPDNRYIFFSVEFGESLPEILADIDNDKRAELLAPSPQSDVSPVYYRILKWKHNRFIDQKPYALMVNKHARDQLLWVNPVTDEEVLDNKGWVSRFLSANKNSAVVEITYYNSNNEVKFAKAKIKFAYYGAYVTKWIKPFEINKDIFYYAKISNKDHYNSKMVRLYSLRAILRQDRANLYHRKGDIDDTKTSNLLFKSINKRSLFNSFNIIPINTTLRHLTKVVVYKNPLLKVKIKGNKLLITVIKE